MSILFTRYIKHGYRFVSPYDGFWQLGTLEGTVDPIIPNLPIDARLSVALAVTESPDVVAIAVDAVGGSITASFAVTETSDTVAITGTNVTTASLAVTETSDTVAITGSNRTTFTLAATETSDTVAITGSNRTTASLAVTETADTVSITGSNRTTASLAVTESSDVVAFDVSLASSTATVSFAITEPSDSVFFGVQAAADQPIGGGHAWKGPAEPKYRVHPEYEDKPRKKRKREKVGEQVILAGEPEIQTGIIEVTPARDALGELQRKQAEAEQARRDRLRAIALADDEWLMVA